MTITKGTTRIVILIGSFAIKIPNFTNGWDLFLTGLLCNQQEKVFSRTGWKELCPVIFAVPGGWFNVMIRARPLTEEEWSGFDYEGFVSRKDGRVPAENKRCSFGVVMERNIVAVDYG